MLEVASLVRPQPTSIVIAFRETNTPMSSRFFVSHLAALVLACCGVVSAADPPRPPPKIAEGKNPRSTVAPLIGAILAEPSNFSVALLGSEQIQKELSLSSEQQSMLKSLREQIAGEIRKGLEDLRNLSPEEEKAKVAELRAKIKTKSQSIGAMVSRLLSREQSERLRQIVIQVRGVASLGDQDVATSLKLTESQQTRLRAVRDETRDKIHNLFRGFKDATPEDRRQKVGKMRGEIRLIEQYAMRRASRILTAEQRSEFEKIQGAKFEIDLAKLVPPHSAFADRRAGGVADPKDSPRNGP